MLWKFLKDFLNPLIFLRKNKEVVVEFGGFGTIQKFGCKDLNVFGRCIQACAREDITADLG